MREDFIIFRLVADMGDNGQNDRNGCNDQANDAFLVAFGRLGCLGRFKFVRHSDELDLAKWNILERKSVALSRRDKMAFLSPRYGIVMSRYMKRLEEDDGRGQKPVSEIPV